MAEVDCLEVLLLFAFLLFVSFVPALSVPVGKRKINNRT